MAIDSAGVSASTSATLEIKGLQLAQSQQQAEGQATLELIEGAEIPQSSSANPAIGSNVDTFA